jgi:hypothetical protein
MKTQPLAQAKKGSPERVVCIDQALEQLDEAPPHAWIQSSHCSVMRASDGRLHAPDELHPLRGQPAHLQAAIVVMAVASYQASAFKAPQHAGHGGPIDADLRRQRCLVDRGMIDQHRHQAELDGRDAEIGTLLQEDRDVDLMEPADQKAGALS